MVVLIMKQKTSCD